MRTILLIILIMLQFVDLFMSFKAVYVDNIAREANPLIKSPEVMFWMKFVYVIALILFYWYAPENVWLIVGGVVTMFYMIVVGNNIIVILDAKKRK